MPDISVQQEQTPIVGESGRMQPVFKAWVREVTKLNPIIGTGTPEGVVTADQYSLYIDEAVPLTPVEYRKMLPNIGGDDSQGWAQT